LQWKTFFDSPFGEVKKFVTKSPARQLAGNAQNNNESKFLVFN
jgi:hypothetical protein